MNNEENNQQEGKYPIGNPENNQESNNETGKRESLANEYGEHLSVKDKFVALLGRMKKRPKLSLTFALVVAVVIVTFSIQGGGDTLADNEDEETEEKQEMFLKEGLMSASVKDYDEASVYLDKVDYDNLSEDEKEVVLNVYLYAGQPDKSISLEQDFDERVVEYYKNIDDTEKIQELANNDNFDTAEFQFEMAVQNEEDEDIIALQDEVAKDEYKEDKIVNAFINQEEYEKAEQFIASNTLPNKYNERVDNAKDEKEDD